MEGISQVSDEYQIHPLLSQAIISYFLFNKLIKLSLKPAGFRMALFLLWSASTGNVCTDLKRDGFDFLLSKKAENQIANEFNLIQPSLDKSM